MAAPPARVMVDTPAGKKSVAATSSAAKSAAPAQKTYNYHKPAEEPFRAPPVQKTYNYHKPAQDGPATPPRAEGPRGFGSTPVGSMPKAPDTLLNKAGDFFFPDAFRPLPNSRKSNFAADMASPLLGNAYDLASTAMTMTPDKNSYVPVPVQRLNHYLSNMGLAGLSALAAPVYGAAGLTADVANKLGVPRPEALARDLGAMLDVAGILPEGRMLSAMVPEATTSRVSKVPEDIPTQTPAETLINQTDVAPITPPAAETNLGQMAPEDIAFDDELNRIFGPPTPNDPFPEDIANAAALRNRQDLEDPFNDPANPAFRPLNYLDDIFPTVLERAQRGEPLTDQEAFDVMTFERHGRDGIYDPLNTFENWGQQTNNDVEGAERIAFLTGVDRNAGHNPVTPVEGPYFANGFGFEYIDDTPELIEPNYPDEYDIDFDEPDPFRYVTEDTAVSKPSQFRPRPLVRREEGIASMYSPTRRAVEQLRQSRFPDPVSMEKQLLALGAKPDELESLLKRIGTSDVAEGGLKKLRLAELADEAATEVQQFRRPDRDYEDRHLPGAIDPHVTTFEAPGATPKGVGQHFGARVPGSSVLAHIRSAMFSTPGANRPNVYHISEIQSDWAQFRVKLLPTADDLSVEASVYNDYLTEFEEARGMNIIYDFDPDMAKMGERIALTKRYGTREEFDKNYPAPYVKTTRKWHQLALKQALTEAVNSDAEYMSLATGEQAKSYTGGTLEGQQMFYDRMTPRELDDILTKFSKETGVKKPALEYQFVYGYDGSGYEVPAIRLTDEFKEAMKKYGLPSFAKGGIVTLPT